ncbi:MAG: long-chain fatty acid--CoA ligase [Proteobacteria bacterium]|nr:long-chain fatty acid--CoA ligase [Pseudomonadota bacterium]
MESDTWPTLTAMFFDQAERLGEHAFLWAKSDGRYRALGWAETAERVRALAQGLRSLGLEPGDRVVLVSENRPEWLIADVGIMAAGCITVPSYTTNTADDHLHVLEDSGARAAIVSTAALATRLLPAVARSAKLQWVITIETPTIGQASGASLHGWDEVMELGRGEPGKGNGGDEGSSDVKRSDTACLIYTSGTGGAPKGVMLSHGAILSNTAGAEHVFRDLGLKDEVFLSFLPLSHAYEHTAGQFLPIAIGAEIYYAEGADTLAANMAEARPTLMTAVPRLYETLHLRILRGVARAGGLQKKLFARTLALGTRKYEAPGALSIVERMTDLVLEVVVRRKVRRRFGGRLKAMISGGAALNYDIALFFTALGIPILQGYGQTEAAPVITCNPPGRVKLATVGPPLDGVEIRIAEDGEILVKGELVMQGYWNNEKATFEALRDGWLHTGDIGTIDDDGYLEITDRKRDIIVNSGGDNVSPQRVEGILTVAPEIAQAMVHGDARPYLVALVVPDEETVKRWAKDAGKPADLSALAQDPDFAAFLGRVVDRVNTTLSPVERVRRFHIAPEPFTIANGKLTPTLKLRRHVIGEKYGQALEALYR